MKKIVVAFALNEEHQNHTMTLQKSHGKMDKVFVLFGEDDGVSTLYEIFNTNFDLLSKKEKGEITKEEYDTRKVFVITNGATMRQTVQIFEYLFRGRGGWKGLYEILEFESNGKITNLAERHYAYQ